MSVLDPRVSVTYEWDVSPSSDTPVPPGTYRVRIVEGGTYRNLGSRRKYTVKSVDPIKETLTYTYTRGGGEIVERTGDPTELAVVKSVGDTPPGVVWFSGGELSV